MGWKCVVQNCSTNKCKSLKGISTFKMPSDENLRKKWIAAMSSLVDLYTKNRRICEKHFEEKLIVREYVKYDANGKLIAQVPFRHVRLHPEAVPSIFEQAISRSSHKPIEKSVIDLDHSYILRPEIRRSIMTASNLTVKIDNCCNQNITGVLNNIASTNPATIVDADTVPNSDYDNKAISIDGQPADSVISDDSMDVESKFAILETNAETFENKPQVKVENSTCLGVSVSFECIQFNFDSQLDGALQENLSIVLPKPWNVCKSIFGKEEILLFTCFVETNDCEIEKHILEKTVLVRKSRQMIYEVYSMPIDIAQTKLPQLLTDIYALPEVLKKFKDMRTCKGLVIDFNASLSESIVKDSTNNWRHKKCTLISINKKRCSACQKCNKVFQQRMLRKRRKEIQRTSAINNPVRRGKFCKKKRCKKPTL